ncbi:MAG: hypothetical protein AAFY48_18780 [Bacteroidota bacterium]
MLRHSLKASSFSLLLALFIIPACTYDSLEFQPDCTGVLALELVEVQASTCDQDVGSIEVRLTGEPNPSARFSIDGQNFQEDGRFENLAAGNYTVMVEGDGCSASLDAQVENAAGLNAVANSTASDCGDNNGTIAVAVENANGAVAYKINGGPEQTGEVFNNLAPGEYMITVSDATGCEVSLEATVNSNIAYAAIETIINSSCAVSGCHAGNVSPDFRDKNNVLNNASRIKSRTAAQSMPPSSSGISLTPDQIEAISCWVDDGAQG